VVEYERNDRADGGDEKAPRIEACDAPYTEYVEDKSRNRCPDEAEHYARRPPPCRSMIRLATRPAINASTIPPMIVTR